MKCDGRLSEDRLTISNSDLAIVAFASAVVALIAVLLTVD